MTMRLLDSNSGTGQRASALLLTMVMTGIAVLTVASVLSYTTSSARLNYRASQYERAIAAAEGATEKVVGMVSHDYLNGGEAAVQANLDVYRNSVLSSSDAPFWGDWEFSDAAGHVGRTYVGVGNSTNYVLLSSLYAGLHGYASSYSIVSNARQTRAPQEVVAGVLQELELARIPIFQFAMYASGDLEISCGQPFVVTGRVHANGTLYVEPDNALTFQSYVSAVGDVLFQRHPLDTRVAPKGTVVYQAKYGAHVPAMTLPIGTSNSPLAIREIIQPAPAGEPLSSAMGRLRYYNLSDMLVVVANSGTNISISGSSGSFNGFATVIPTNELKLFVNVSANFWDEREGKTVLPIDIDIGSFTAWSATNNSVRAALGSNDVASIYVWDRRALAAGNLGAVRVLKGRLLPSRGLTVATARPLYVWGHYNQYASTNLGTANTRTTFPASLVGDSLTVLSENWSDANSTAAVGSRTAFPTTVNAAILAGAVDTYQDHYSGGVENFPRFLETWGLSNPLTYNGSMVKLFPSQYAVSPWGKANVYGPPARNWTYDTNFDNPALLPPNTPSVLKVVRGLWAATAPNQTTAPVH
jgi:hypothetical protein